MQPVEVKRFILLVSCAIVFLGLIPVLRLRIPSQPKEETALDFQSDRWSWLRAWKLSPFLWRFLPLMALWSAVLAAFNPFGQRLPVAGIACPDDADRTDLFHRAGAAARRRTCDPICSPRTWVSREASLLTQILAAVALGLMGGAKNGQLAVPLYLTFSAAQWMSSPGVYNLLMNETPDAERSTAAAMMLFCDALDRIHCHSGRRHPLDQVRISSRHLVACGRGSGRRVALPVPAFDAPTNSKRNKMRATIVVLLALFAVRCADRGSVAAGRRAVALPSDSERGRTRKHIGVARSSCAARVQRGGDRSSPHAGRKNHAQP